MEIKITGKYFCIISREMAASDLCTEIEKGKQLEPSLEKAICQAYMKQLSDSSLGVQGNN